MTEEAHRHLKWPRDEDEPALHKPGAQDIYCTNIVGFNSDSAFLAIAAYCALMSRVMREQRFVLSIHTCNSTMDEPGAAQTALLSINLEGTETFQTLVDAFRAALIPGNEFGTAVV